MAWILDKLFRIGLPFNGEFLVYEGSYVIALWRWMRGEEDEDE